MRSVPRVVPLLLGLSLPACRASPDEPAPTAVRDEASPPATASAPPELVRVPAGATDGPGLVRAELERARSDGRELVIYVGASWCEPCTRFHDALLRHELDAELAGVRFLDFDHDAHEALLRQADCGSELIPLFARADEDGTCSTRRVEGGIKGEGAVGHLLPRLRGILRRPR